MDAREGLTGMHKLLQRVQARFQSFQCCAAHAKASFVHTLGFIVVLHLASVVGFIGFIARFQPV